jgi:hypothetical protein
MNGEFCVAVHALVYLHHCDRVLSSEELAKKHLHQSGSGT